MKQSFYIIICVLLLTAVIPPVQAESQDSQDQAFIEAMEKLKLIGIINEDQAMKLGAPVTRSEFAKIATRLKGMETFIESFNRSQTNYSDVPADHWASGYIHFTTSQGILQGYPDGTFQPEKIMSHAEVISVLIRLLGYEPVVQGQWPYNYISQAEEIGLMEGVTDIEANEPPSLRNVILYVNNALDIPKMVQTSFGEYASYEVSGTNEPSGRHC